ncbi:hypothetical protein GCM10027256_24830 [Novispirillum itersonii subsp. nipponicum]
MPSVNTSEAVAPADADAAADLSLLTVCVWCPDPLVAEALLSSLAAEGVTAPIMPDSWAHLLKILDGESPDVLYALVSPATLPQIADLFRGIRTGDIGSNPFLALDVVTRYPQSPVLETMVDSGADDILPYHWPQQYVRERLIHLALKRKKFVITSAYVGPDRRRTPRPGGGQPEPLFDVPNPVKAKAVDGLSVEELIAQVEVARDQMLAERMGRLGLYLARCVMDIRESTLAPRDGMVMPLTQDDKRIIAASTTITALAQRLDGPARWSATSANDTIRLARLVMALSHEGTEHPDPKALQVAARQFLSRFGSPSDTAALHPTA